jgi:hypothetical protein
MEFWAWMTIGVFTLLLSLCVSAKHIMRYEWELKKRELEALNNELETLGDLTDELQSQKNEIERLLRNEFFDYDALFKKKKNND